MQQLHRDLTNRGHCPVILKQLFTEVSNILKREKETIGSEPVADVQLELKVEKESKDMKKILLLHQECHPKDVSRYALQRVYRETCGSVFKDLLGVDKAMVACHKPKNLKDLVMPSRMKDCNEVDLKASTYVKKQRGKAMGVVVKVRVQEIVVDYGASVGVRETLYENFKLVEQDIHYDSYKKKFMISASRNKDKNEKLLE